MRAPSLRTARTLVAVGLLATLACVAPVDDEREPASIPFADIGAIREFRPVGDDAMLIEGTRHRWFLATFFGRCIGLRSAEQIAFVTEPGGSLDRFSAIYVDGRRCAFRSFERTEPPARKEREEKR